MSDILQLQLSLLRGETSSPMDFTAFGRPSRLRLQVQKKAALSDRLAVNLLGMIAIGRLPPGSRLPPERRIADALNASRVCVRSALDRLKDLGYVEAVQGSGTRVSSASGRLDALAHANRENLDDLAGFRRFFDSILLARAMERDIPGLAADISELQASHDEADPQAIAQYQFDLRFLLAERSGSQVYPMLLGHLERGFRNYFAAALAAGVPADVTERFRREDRRILEAVACGDVTTATCALAAQSDAIEGLLVPVAERRSAPAEELGEEVLLRELAADQPETLRDTVSREITRMIATGQLERGDRLLSERRLADLFGISRVSVREALAKLKQQGLITASERFGTRARPSQLADGLAGVATDSFSSFRELCELRHHLEVWAARRAAQRASDVDLADMRRILAEMRRPIDAPQRMIDLDLNLHLTIARAAGSALHLFIAEVLRNLVTGYFNHSLTDTKIGGGRDPLLLQQHGEIVAAITERDEARAAIAMERHVRTFRESYEAEAFGARVA